VSHPSNTPEDRYAALVEALVSTDAVTFGSSGKKGFGSKELKVGGKIFAMLSKGRLVVKLSQQRVDALIASGDGARFDLGHGRFMKEWLSVAPSAQADWLPLAREALEFVASKG
jgi:TfoX/Sxy family transcriptional regulator of competence genes